MIYSMTGFGKAEVQLSQATLAIDLRSLNSRYFDCKLKLHPLVRSLEPTLRTLLQKNLVRGKVELSIHATESKEQTVTLNRTVLASYIDQITTLANEKKVEPSVLMHGLLQLPDVAQNESPSLSENEEKQVLKAVETAIAELGAFRRQEGQAMSNDFKRSLATIEQGMKTIEALDKPRVDRRKNRLKAELEQLQLEADANRFEQEMIYYLEKYDINEELSRLSNHCQYFAQVMDAEAEQNGKKLNFIAQEMGREINTIGSKANDADMQQEVVQLKDELERIKEQINNVL